MKTYYCRNGESVLVSPDNKNPNLLIVLYKNRRYFRPKSCIGITLFKENPLTVCINSRLLLVDLSTGESSAVKIIAAHHTTKYIGMGGSYYGARTEKEGDMRAGRLSGNIILITDDSPIGKAAMGKRRGDCINVIAGDNCTAYRIERIDNSFMMERRHRCSR